MLNNDAVAVDTDGHAGSSQVHLHTTSRFQSRTNADKSPYLFMFSDPIFIKILFHFLFSCYRSSGRFFFLFVLFFSFFVVFFLKGGAFWGLDAFDAFTGV